MSILKFIPKQHAVSDWAICNRIEPFAIIFVPNAEDVEHVAGLCRRLLQKSNMNTVNVFCLNKSIEIESLIENESIDILVTTVFCFRTIRQHLPKLFRSERLRYIWFHQIDEMCQVNESLTWEAVNECLSSREMDIQVNRLFIFVVVLSKL